MILLKKVYNIKAKANKTIINGYLKNINRNELKIQKNTVEINKSLQYL